MPPNTNFVISMSGLVRPLPAPRTFRPTRSCGMHSVRERLLGFARSWLYEHRLIIVHERLLRSMIAVARPEHEAQLARRIDHAVEPGLLMSWCGALTAPHGSGSSLQTWLWAPPAKHSSRQIEEMVDRIECLYALSVQERLSDFPDDLLRCHARRLAGRPPSAGALIQEPARSIETACFLRYCLLTATDRLLLMVRRQVADLWRRAAMGATVRLGDWALLYQELLAALGAIVAEPAAGDEGILERHLSTGTRIFLGRVWQEVLDNPDRERAFCAFEVATLLALRRALRNGTLWIDHSLAFRSRERLFVPADRWQAQRRSYFRRLGLPTEPVP
jgi:hypothetical protein